MVSSTQLSNSAVEAFFECPSKYANRYVAGWTQQVTPSYFGFGQRMHELLQEHYCPGVARATTVLDATLENEAQAVLVAYQAAYAVEPFEVVACEVPFELVVAGSRFTGRIDMLVRDVASGRLQILETKTESRGSKRNLPIAWLARHQGSYYCHAATQLYGEQVDTILLNVITRGSPGKQIGPAFRRDNLHRSAAQVAQALSDLRYVAAQVSLLGSDPDAYPRATSHCVGERGYACEYYAKCHMGSTEGLVQITDPFAYQKV